MRILGFEIRRAEPPAAPINFNDLAVHFSKVEGGPRQVDITQIRQLLRAFCVWANREMKNNPQGLREFLARTDTRVE